MRPYARSLVPLPTKLQDFSHNRLSSSRNLLLCPPRARMLALLTTSGIIDEGMSAALELQRDIRGTLLGPPDLKRAERNPGTPVACKGA